MSLTTAGIHCMISQRLSGAMEDCSIVRVQQSRTLCRQSALCLRHDTCSARCSTQPPLMSIGDKTAVVGQVRWQNARQWLVDERGHLEVIASVADGALAIYGRSVKYWSTDGQRHSEATAAGSSVLRRCQRTANCNSPGGRKWTPGLMSYSHLQTATGQPGAAGSLLLIFDFAWSLRMLNKLPWSQ